MTNFISILIAIEFIALAVYGQVAVPDNGNCPDYKPIDNFDMSRFQGQWHEIYHYQKSLSRAQCDVVVNFKTLTSTSMELTANSTAKRTEYVRDPSQPLSGTFTDFSVLETDYDNYALLWDCRSGWQSGWVLSRSKMLPGSVIWSIAEYFDLTKLIRTPPDCPEIVTTTASPPARPKPVSRNRNS